MSQQQALSDIDILRLCETVFAPWFKDPRTWEAWKAFLATLFALELSPERLKIAQECTGRMLTVRKNYREAALICGRRSGKSLMVALIAVFLACFRDWRQFLAPGEPGVVLVMASDKRQARVIFRYIRGFLREIPALEKLVVRETEEEIELSTGIIFEICAANIKAPRGRTIIVFLGDEVAFWPSDGSANPDTDIIAAVQPATATVPGSVLLCVSTPYARKGFLYNQWKTHFGKDDSDVLIWRAGTRVMNPTVSAAFIEKKREQDPAATASEFDVEWRTDISSFADREKLEELVVPGRKELPYIAGTFYHAFVDPSGGRSDSMTLAISHLEGERVILDYLQEWRPPFSPESVVDECVAQLKAYRCSHVTGDRYGGEWPREQFRKRGIEYRLSDRPASDIYRDGLPLLNGGRAELLDNSRLISQLCSLERRVRPGGKDMISHPVSGHDDVAVAAMGSLVQAVHRKQPEIVNTPPIIITLAPYRDPTKYPAPYGRDY